MKFANSTNLNRKSGVAQWRDLRFSQPSELFLDGDFRTKRTRCFFFADSHTLSQSRTEP